MIVSVFVIAAALQAPAASATTGCQKDIDCKGTRVCEQHECVFPPPKRAKQETPPNPPPPAVPATATVPAKAVANACAPLVPAVAMEGASVRAGPDSLTSIISTLRAATPLCAAATSQGYGFRRVKLADATVGYIKASELSE